ncbi:hypothetical protein ABL78_0572 [Leptomonas seymouri]|uniref:Uncharacterized protein n=1 Tax=Leptomonas seymouri TaxID=5684 RepID=A0A0N1I3I1_LEPSE|nr:hypothetical protein ABL78_0572 [Leptomonas seymouri]|eukprot:KPI90345.1 hypothetical protein ABL78_0572 [Leptomonas seymouri]
MRPKMEAPRLLARYHPATRTLEFDLSDAPLVDAVVDVSVLSTHLVPCAEPTEVQQGLFYGKDTFLFERPFVFDADHTMLTCWLRIREYRVESLQALATQILQRTEGATFTTEETRAPQRECIAALAGTATLNQLDAESLYFATPLLHTPSDGVGPVSDLPAPLSLCTVPHRAPSSDATLFSASAVALCCEL